MSAGNPAMGGIGGVYFFGNYAHEALEKRQENIDLVVCDVICDRSETVARVRRQMTEASPTVLRPQSDLSRT